MSLRKLLPVIMAMALASPNPTGSRPMREFTPLSDEEKERLKNDRLKAKGLKEFWVHGECIVASSERVAINKYNKRKK